MQLDVIDLEAPITVQAKMLRRVCSENGFFRIPLESVSADVATEAWNAASEFFALPDEIKQSAQSPEAGYPYGYSPLNHERLARSLGELGPADFKESLAVGPDCLGAPPVVDPQQAWVRSPSIWPHEPIGLRDAWTRYYRELSEVAERLLVAIAVALGAEADHFATLVDHHISAMRAIHYPTIEDGGLGGVQRAGAHTDYGTLTILRTDDVAGLEIRTSAGWEPVEPDPNTFIVNLGDSIQRWTNGHWRSTLHRVSATTGGARQSFAFFHTANWDATIECLPSCLPAGEDPPDPPVMAGPWLMKKFTATVMIEAADPEQ